MKKVIAFLCNWCSYAGADLAGVSRFQYPPITRTIRVPCSGRVNPLYLFKALYEGADAVWVSGCHPGDCHYQTGNYYARRRFAIFNALMDYVGFEKGRVFFSWISASEGKKFAETVKHIKEEVEKLPPRQKFLREND
ncbi:hydrogenase iron-sulfur subunit [bacterium]|nr:MAG: hydrogenase iron-sulfur subunit [bacterium]